MEAASSSSVPEQKTQAVSHSCCVIRFAKGQLMQKQKLQLPLFLRGPGSNGGASWRFILLLCILRA